LGTDFLTRTGETQKRITQGKENKFLCAEIPRKEGFRVSSRRGKKEPGYVLGNQEKLRVDLQSPLAAGSGLQGQKSLSQEEKNVEYIERKRKKVLKKETRQNKSSFFALEASKHA